jgi:hypothetical protein
VTPRPRRSRQDQRAFRPCAWCGRPVLTAETAPGQVVHLDVLKPTYGVTWSDQSALPTAVANTAYVEHQCRGTCPARPRSV